MIIQNDPRRWKERADGSMIAEDHSAIANLSPDVMMREIPHHDIPVNPATDGNVPHYGRPLPYEPFGNKSSRVEDVFMMAATKKGRAT